MEYYTGRTKNTFVAGGLLQIVALKETTNGASFTSARLKSQGLAAWNYLRVFGQKAPLKLSQTRTNNALLVSWPSNIVGRLQAQINPSGGLGTNWADLALRPIPPA